MIEIEKIKDLKEIVLDSGVIIEYFKSTKGILIKVLRENLFNEQSQINLYGHFLMKSEIFYVLCRSIGIDDASEKLKEIEDFIEFINGKYLFQIAGQIKCKFPIALSDCYSIATDIFKDCPILFLKEKELSEDIVNKINKEFKSKILLIP